MSLTTEDEKKIFDALAPARAFARSAEQGFAAVEGDPYGRELKERERKAVEAIVKQVLGGVHHAVKKAREAGTSRIQIYQYYVSPLYGGKDWATKNCRAACERILAAINTSPDLLAWTEDLLDGAAFAGVKLMLDFSRLHARSLTTSLTFTSDPQ